MLLFLAKILFVIFSILGFPINFVRVLLYNYIAKKMHDQIIKDAKKMFGGKGFDNLHKKQ